MKYRPEIDGLRALAVIPVILYHAGFKLFSGGYVGVDIFFVISGYLITSIILAELENGTFSLTHFYERRARRILPALFLMMFACLPFAWMWLVPDAMEEFSKSLIAVTSFMSNALFCWAAGGYFNQAAELKPLIHTWSLAVEEQFYVLFPLFLILTWKFDKRWMIGLLLAALFISLISAQWLLIRYPSFTFYMLPTRAWELLIGTCIAFYYARHNIKIQNHHAEQLGSLTGLTLIAYAVFTFNNETPFPGINALVPTMGAAFIIIFTTPKTAVGRLLGSKLFVGVGLISYSTYLWHQPIFAFVKERMLNQPSMSLMAGLIMLSLVLAYLSWRYVEKPFRNINYFSQKQIFLYSALCGLFFISIGLVGAMTDGITKRFQISVHDTLHPESAWSNSKTGCDLPSGDALRDVCILGDKNNIVGAIIGDSHAMALGYEYELALQSQGSGAYAMMLHGCPPIYGIYNAHFPLRDCNKHNNAAFNLIKNNAQIDYVIISSRWIMLLNKSGFDNGEGGNIPTNFRINLVDIDQNLAISEELRKALIKEKYLEFIKMYLATGKKIILVYPVPEVGWNVPKFISKSILFHGQKDINLSTSHHAYQTRNQEVIDMLDSIGDKENLVRIYPDKLLCNTFMAKRCIASLNGVPLYIDDNHLSNLGARLVINEVMKNIIQKKLDN